MTTPLPTIISDYQAAADRGDFDATVACFTDGGAVIDQGQEAGSHANILQWLKGAATEYERTVEVRDATALGTVDGLERHDVFTHLEGNFAAGTVDLMARLGLLDGRVASLEFVSTQADVA
jgi:hypothetical protein